MNNKKKLKFYKKNIFISKYNKLNFILSIFFLIAIFIFLLSSYKIIIYLIETPKVKEEINIIKANTEIIEYDSKEAEIIKNNENIESQYHNYIEMDLINVDFNKLKAKNNDTVAWLIVGGTNIDYPVVQTTNNEYYLNHSFDKTKNSAGWIFMDYRNKNDTYEKNTIIYGHNMKNKTMFGTLKKVLTKEWYKNENNRIITMSSEKNNTLWQIYSIYIINTTNDYIKTDFQNDNDYQNFINLVKNRSIYNFKTNVNTTDKTLTLSTCHDSTKKLVLHAKLIKIEVK